MSVISANTWRQKIREEIKAVFAGENKISEGQAKMGLDKTIFHALLESDLPPEDKSQDRLYQEGRVVIGAGSETTAHALTITHFHILDNLDVQQNLRAELVAALPDRNLPVDLKVVEKLPYLVRLNLSFISKIKLLICLRRMP
jgi:cytochrome P450